MDSLEDEKKKLHYEINHPEYRFSYISKTVFDIPSEKLEEVIKSINLEPF